MKSPNHHVPPRLKEDYETFLTSVSGPLRITKDERRQLRQLEPMHFLPWSMAVLGGGEYATNFPANAPQLQTDFRGIPQARGLMGGNVQTDRGIEFDTRHGRLAKQVRALALQAGKSAKAAQSLETVNVAAGNLTHSLIEHTTPQNRAFGRSGIPVVPSIRLRNKEGVPFVEIPQSATTESIVIPLRRKLGHVATMGPGLTGATFGRDLKGIASDVHFVSGGMGASFINTLVERQLETSVDVTNELPRRHYYAGGIAAGVEGMTEALDGTKLDVFVMGSVHHAGVDECRAGVRGAHTLLEDGGLFVIKAPTESPAHFAGLDSLVGTMAEVGFKPLTGGHLQHGQVFGPSISGQTQTHIPTGYMALQK